MTKIDPTSPSYDGEFERELRVHEALDVASTTPVHAISFFMAFSVMLLQIGFSALTWPAVGSLLVVITMNALGMQSYFALRHKPRPKNISHRRMRIILITSLILGTGWGCFNFFMMPHLVAHKQMTLYLFASIAAFGGATTYSLRVCWGFSGPLLFLTWLAMLLWGPMAWYIVTLLTMGIILATTQLTFLTRRIVTDGVRLRLANTHALNDQLAAEEELRRAEAEQSNMQRALVNAVPFPLVLTCGNEALEITPQAREQFAVNNIDVSSFTLTQFFADTNDQQTMLDILDRDGIIDDFEVLMQNLRGEKFWCAISMRPLVYNNQDCWLNAIYVIDARKRMEQDLASSKETAENALTDLKAAQETLIHVEKIASLGQLTAGIAHEIKNPLNFVNNFSVLSGELMDELVEILDQPIKNLAPDTREDAEDLVYTLKENLQKIDQHGRRADSIVKNMLLHSRETSGDKQMIDLNALVEEAVNLAYHGARASDSTFEIQLTTNYSDEVGMIECLPQELQRVVLNLCANGMYAAVQAHIDKSTPAVLHVTTAAKNDRYEIFIADNGDGIPQDIQDKIYDPFFTTKPSGEGTGLGLSMSFDIIRQHAGELSFTSDPEQGTTFSISLPRTANDLPS